jgi:hypothetical protein
MHDDRQGEKIAGWYHLGFAAAYILAAIWHFRGARDHFRRS